MSLLAILLLTASSLSEASSLPLPSQPTKRLELQVKEFDPFPNNEGPTFHFDLSRNFFQTPQVEADKRAALLKQLRGFDSNSNVATRSPAVLLHAFRTQDALNQEAIRHIAYLELRFYSDTRLTESMTAATELRGELAESFRGFDSALRRIPRDKFREFQGSLPDLSKYVFFFESQFRGAPRSVSFEAEKVFEAVTPLASDWASPIFFATLASTDFGMVHTQNGDLSVRRSFEAIESNPEAGVRKEGYKRNQDGLALHKATYATILVRQASSLNTLSKIRGYSGYAEESYGDRFLDKKQVSNLFQRLATASKVNKQIEKTLDDHIARVHGLGAVHPWDRMLPEPGMEVPRFTAREAIRIVEEAMKPLGEEYQRELSSLLNPANGRLDIAPSPTKANRQGFSTGFVGFPSMFFQGSFSGYVGDVVTLAHESGHAVQNMLMSNHGVLPRYVTGPAYFTESFAGLCELLVLDYLYAHAADHAHRAYFLQRLTMQGAEVFRAAWESMLEQEVFEGVAAGRPLDADEIEAMTQSVASRFSSWFGDNSERKLAWIQPTQFFTRPLYRLNYVYSKLLALDYFRQLHEHPSQFQTRYIGLLSNGYTSNPDSLLRWFAGVGLDDQALVGGAMKTLEGWTSELQRVFRE